MVGEELMRLLKEKPSLLTPLKIKYSEKKSSFLVCDLNSVVVWLCGIGNAYCNKIDVLDLDSLSSKMISFVRALRYMGVEPVFFCNSVTSFSCREDFEFTLPQTRFEYLMCVESVVHKNRKMSVYQKFALYCTNPLIYVQAQLLLASLNVRILSAAGNCMSEAVSFAVNNNALGVLSYNPEFALFPGVSYIHIDYFDLERDMDTCSNHPIVTPQEVICAVVTVDVLSAEFGLSRAGITDLAIVLGNSFSLYLNDKYCLKRFIRLTGKGLKSVVTFLKGYQSPVFETCLKLAYFCDLNKEYRYAVIRSMALYNQPHLFRDMESSEGEMARWVKENVIAGLLPSYFYAIANFGIYIQQPFFESHSISHSKIHESMLFFRKILYFLLGVEAVFEYGCMKNKSFVEVKVEIPGLSCALLKLKNIWSFPIEVKCELLTLLVMSSHSSDLTTELLSTLMIQSKKNIHVPVMISYWILVVGLFLLCKSGVCDGRMFDAIYVSVLMHLAGIPLVLPHRYDNTSGDIGMVTEFSYVLQLVYDLAMLLGLIECLPIPNLIFNPSLSLRVLLLSSSSCYCHLCDEYYSCLVKKILTLPSIQLLKMKCLNNVLENHDEVVLLLDAAVTDLSNQKRFLECVLADVVCKKHCEITEDLQHSLRHSTSISSVSLSASTESSSINIKSTSKANMECPASYMEIGSHIGIEDECPGSSDDKEITGGVYIENDSSRSSSLESSSFVDHTMTSSSKPKIMNDVGENQSPKSSDNKEVIGDMFVEHAPLAKQAVELTEEVKIASDSNDVIAEQEGEDAHSCTERMSVIKYRKQIIQLISEYRVVCIEGEAGCGKSTMIPQFIMDSSKKYCKIIVCQPRRISAIKLAHHVAHMRSQKCGLDIGYWIGGGENNVLPQSTIIYCTTGYLLKVLLHSPQRIENYTHIILDEIHDRTVTYDFVTLLLRKLSLERFSSKLILMSATMQSPLFVKYFREAFGDDVSKPFYVGNRCHPVKEYFIDQVNEKCVSNPGCFLPTQSVAIHNLLMLSNAKRIGDVFQKLLARGPQIILFTQEFGSELIISQAVCGTSILVFLPGFHEILEYSDFLDEELKGRKIQQHFSIYILHSQVPIEEQEALLQPPPSDKVHVILATNIAESSITIPMLNVVINFGLQKTTKYDYKRRMTCLVKCWCSKAACEQRCGRVGRLSPGKVFHLFPRAFYDVVLPDYDSPEILSNSLSKTLLHARVIAKHIGMDSPSDVLRLAIQPPPFTEMDAAVDELVKMGALVPSASGEASETGQMTLLGEFCLNLPLDIDLCRLILYGLCFNCPIEAIIMAAGLSLKHDCFSMPSRILIKDHDIFLTALSRSIESRLFLDNGNLSDPILLVQVFWEWIKFCDNQRDLHLSRRNLADCFSKEFAINPQRFTQMLSSIICIANKVMAMLSPLKFFYKQLAILTEFMQKNNSTCSYSKNSILCKLVVCTNIDRLRALLVATFMHNLLYGVRKDKSFRECEKKEAESGLIRVFESRFSVSKSILVRQVGEGGLSAVEELVKSVVPNCPVKINMVQNIAVIEFQTGLPDLFRHMCQFWQFCERRFRWSIDKMSIVFDRPYHPREISWFCWSPHLEEVDIQTWRNRTGFVYDVSSDCVPAVAVAASLEGVDCQTRIKARFLTILPSLKLTKLPILLLIAFQSFSSTVMFSVDHSSNTVQSICIESQELPFGLWQCLTSTDLMIVNKLREALSLVLSEGSCKPYLPINEFEKVNRILSVLIQSLNQKVAHTEKYILSMLSKMTLQNNHQGSDSVQIPYYPKYSCSILERAERKILAEYQSDTSPYSSNVASCLPSIVFNSVDKADKSLQISIGIQATTSRPLLTSPCSHPCAHSVNVNATIPSNRGIPYLVKHHTSLPLFNSIPAVPSEHSHYYPFCSPVPQVPPFLPPPCCPYYTMDSTPSFVTSNHSVNYDPSFGYRQSSLAVGSNAGVGGSNKMSMAKKTILDGESETSQQKLSSDFISENSDSMPPKFEGTNCLGNERNMYPLDQTLWSPFDGGIIHGMFEKKDHGQTKSDFVSKIKTELDSVGDEASMALAPSTSQPHVIESSPVAIEKEALNSASISEDEDHEDHVCKSSAECYSQPGTSGIVQITNDLEEKVITFMYSKGKRASLSDIQSNKDLQVLAFVNDETLSIKFFLKRPQWFTVQMFEGDEGKTTYMITLLSLVPDSVKY